MFSEPLFKDPDREYTILSEDEDKIVRVSYDVNDTRKRQILEVFSASSDIAFQHYYVIPFYEYLSNLAQSRLVQLMNECEDFLFQNVSQEMAEYHSSYGEIDDTEDENLVIAKALKKRLFNIVLEDEKSNPNLKMILLLLVYKDAAFLDEHMVKSFLKHDFAISAGSYSNPMAALNPQGVFSELVDFTPSEFRLLYRISNWFNNMDHSLTLKHYLSKDFLYSYDKGALYGSDEFLIISMIYSLRKHSASKREVIGSTSQIYFVEHVEELLNGWTDVSAMMFKTYWVLNNLDGFLNTNEVKEHESLYDFIDEWKNYITSSYDSSCYDIVKMLMNDMNRFAPYGKYLTDYHIMSFIYAFFDDYSKDFVDWLKNDAVYLSAGFMDCLYRMREWSDEGKSIPIFLYMRLLYDYDDSVSSLSPSL